MDDLEREELIGKINLIIRNRYIFLFILALLSVPAIFSLKAYNILFIGLAFAIVVIIYNVFFHVYLGAQREKISISRLISLAVLQTTSDALIITMLVHMTGGVTSPFVVFYFLVVLSAAIILPRSPVTVIEVGVLLSILYDGILIAEYMGAIKPIRFLPMIPLSSSSIQLFSFAIFIPITIILISIFASQVSSLLASKEEDLKGKLFKVERKVQEIAEAKEKSVEKARDLERDYEDLKDSFNELSRLNRIMVGREVEMVRLKQKIKELEGKVQGGEEK